MFSVTLIEWSYIFIFICALVGSIKVNIISQKSHCQYFIDIIAGLLFGCTLGFYYTADHDVWLSGLIALIASMIGSNVIDVVSKLTPKDIKEIILKWLTK